MSKHNNDDVVVAVTKAASGVVRTINDGRCLYYYPREVEYAMRHGLCDIARRPDFIREYKALIRGLPAESVATVSRIISRLQRIKGLTGRLDIYSEAEKLILADVNRIRDEVFAVADDCFCYRTYFLPVNNFMPCVFHYRYGLDLLSNKAALRSKCVIDVGAYVGDSALILSEFTRRRVYAFEASPDNFRYLLRTIALNGLKRVIPENLALGSRTCEAVLDGTGDLCMARRAKGASDVGIHCEMTTLDDYVSSKRLEVGLIKVDIEGGERDFLAGARKTIVSQRPALLISIYHSADDLLLIKPMIERLRAGYAFRIYHPVIKSVFAETLLVCEPKKD